MLELHIVQVGHLIKELVGIDSELVDYLLDDRLHLKEGEDPATNLLVDEILQESHHLGDGDASSPFEELGEHELLLPRDFLAKASDDLGELRPRNESSLVDVQHLDDLPHLQLLLEDGIGNLI